MRHETIEIHAGLGVAVLWLNRPDVRNAFNDTMIAELTAAFGELEQDPAVRAVVLAGRGKVFCAGADLNWMKRMGELDFEENRKDAIAFGTMLAPRGAISSPPSVFRRRRRTASASFRSWRSPRSWTRRSTRSWASSSRVRPGRTR